MTSVGYTLQNHFYEDMMEKFGRIIFRNVGYIVLLKIPQVKHVDTHTNWEK